MLYYASHPEVAVDPSLPVDEWRLSGQGQARARALLEQPWIKGLSRICSSPETKARQTAHVVAHHLNLPIETLQNSGENDRTATGFLPPDQFEEAANQFFAKPSESYQGWERATDAQRRIAEVLGPVLVPALGVEVGVEVGAELEGDTLVVGHGAVGTLWYCFLNDLPIDRSYDQPHQGHFFAVEQSTRRTLHDWHPFEAARSTTN